MSLDTCSSGFIQPVEAAYSKESLGNGGLSGG